MKECAKYCLGNVQVHSIKYKEYLQWIRDMLMQHINSGE